LTTPVSRIERHAGQNSVPTPVAGDLLNLFRAGALMVKIPRSRPPMIRSVHMLIRRRACLVAFAAVALLVLPTAGCGSGGADADAVEIVVYTSVDAQYAAAVADRFHALEDAAVEAGEIERPTRVRLVTDSELNKTVGLAARLIAERESPRCDVWWANEPSQTIRLAGEGLFAPYESPEAAGGERPATYIHDGHLWTMCALRLRVLVVRSDGPGWPDDVPFTMQDLPAAVAAAREATPEGEAGTFALADTRAGTSATHAAAIFQALGEEAAREWFTQLRDAGTTIAAGNAHTVKQTASGAARWGITDTDDVFAAVAENKPVESVVVPGTLAIPCTASLVAGAPNPAGAKRFIDFLLSADGERAMAEVDARHYPTRRDVTPPDGFPEPGSLDLLPVDWESIEPARQTSQAALAEIFAG
jgi:iron(III) transport system substrate-binding protein